MFPYLFITGLVCFLLGLVTGGFCVANAQLPPPW